MVRRQPRRSVADEESLRDATSRVRVAADRPAMPNPTTEGPPERIRHLVLVGGGHTHVHVLRALAMRPEPGLRVTLVSPGARSHYSGMLPGRLAGLYDLEESSIDVAALSARAKYSPS